MNSMEEDINNLIEELTKVRPDELSKEGLKLFNKINEIIYKNRELEENNKLLIQQNITYKKNIHDLKHNNIPVSLVEETIEEYKNEIDKLYNQKVWNEPMDTIYNNRYVNYINILQELLEKRK